MSTQVQMMVVIAAATTTATVEEAILTVDISLHQTTVTIIIVATIPVAVTMGPLHQHQQVAVEHLHQLDNYIWHIYGNSLQYTNVPR